MKPCVVIMAINFATEKALQKSSASEHLSSWKICSFVLVHELCGTLRRHPCGPALRMPQPCADLLLPSCVLPAVIHSHITTVNMEHALTLTSNTWPSDSWGFLLAPLHLFSYALLIYISVSLIVDSVAPLVCTSHFFFSLLLFHSVTSVVHLLYFLHFSCANLSPLLFYMYLSYLLLLAKSWVCCSVLLTSKSQQQGPILPKLIVMWSVWFCS